MIKNVCITKVPRGGSYLDFLGIFRCTFRNYLDPTTRYDNYGFRVAKKEGFIRARVLRGGSWGFVNTGSFRYAGRARNRIAPVLRYYRIGFRVAKRMKKEQL